jgi:outer membrane protein OmpA-like peptidoglycan-associated protein
MAQPEPAQTPAEERAADGPDQEERERVADSNVGDPEAPPVAPGDSEPAEPVAVDKADRGVPAAGVVSELQPGATGSEPEGQIAPVPEPPADLPVSDRVTPQNVSIDLQLYFEPFSSEVTERAQGQLDWLAGYLEQYRANRIRIIGHVAAVGDPALNKPLSEERALEVRRYLVEVHAFSPDALVAEGRGGDEPIADNSTPDGRALNRRVEIVVELSSPVENGDASKNGEGDREAE